MYLDQSYWNCQNPEFLEMAQLVTDPYWQEKLLLAAKGKFPKKVSYRNGEIRFRKNSSMATEKLPKDPVDAATLVIQFIRKFTGLSSELDKRENLRQLSSVSSRYIPIRDCSWKHIKGKGSKIDIMNRYSREIATAMSLTELQRCQLLKTIQCGLICGQLSNDHVIMKVGRINQITGLYYDDSTATFKLDPRLAPYKPSKPVDSRVVIDLRESYVKRRTSAKGMPVIGNAIKSIVDYFTWQLSMEEAARTPVGPTFIIVDINVPDYSSDTSPNSIEPEPQYNIESSNEQSPPKDVLEAIDMIESMPDNWTGSPDSYDNSTSRSSIEGYR